MSALGGVVGAIGNIFAGNMAAKGQEKAAKLQAQQFQQTKDLLTPYTNAGSGALDVYKTSVGLNGAGAQKDYFNNFQTDPGWQAATNFATRGVQNLDAIQGHNNGGNLIAGLGDYLQKNMLGAYQTRQSQLGGLVDTGRTAASSLGGFSANYANQAGANLANAGYYQGAGLANAGNSVNSGLNNYGQQQAYLQGQGIQSGAGNSLTSLFGFG
jgi:hypothetical protein